MGGESLAKSSLTSPPRPLPMRLLPARCGDTDGVLPGRRQESTPVNPPMHPRQHRRLGEGSDPPDLREGCHSNDVLSSKELRISPTRLRMQVAALFSWKVLCSVPPVPPQSSSEGRFWWGWRCQITHYPGEQGRGRTFLPPQDLGVSFTFLCSLTENASSLFWQGAES